MADDNTNHKISEVMSGQTEQSEVEVKNVTITAMSEETVQNVTLAKEPLLSTWTSSIRHGPPRHRAPSTG